jgi:iron complex transport system ATP-binding protein
MLEALGAGFSVRGRRLLADISLTAQPGELTLIIGPNGAGKSTLISLLSGLRHPTEGLIRLNGIAPQTLSANKLARLRAVVEQHAGWQPGLTAAELAMMGAYLTQDTTGDWREAMRLTQCLELADRRLETLSGGELQRVHLARALLQLMTSTAAERYLLLDEPTAALDFGLADSLMAQIRVLAREYRLGVVAVVHDLNLALRHADQVLLMDSGRGIAFGAAADIMQKERLETLYGVRLAELVSADAQHRAFVPMQNHAN